MKQRHKQRGSLLVVALFLIIVVVAFVTVLSRILATSAHSNIVEYYGTLAFLAAQSGIEWKLNRRFGPGIHTLTVYEIIEGNTKWPHKNEDEDEDEDEKKKKSILKVEVAGTITIEDSNGISDENFDDYSDHWGPTKEPIDSDDQIVLKSSVDDIEIGDFVDSRYSLLIKTGSDTGFSAEIYFLATNQGNNYGKYFVSTEPLIEGETYYFDGYNQSGVVNYNDLVFDKSCITDLEHPNFTQNMRYMPNCSVEVSCEVIRDVQVGSSTNSSFQNFYRISSTAKCESGRFSTERTIHVDAKTL